MARQGQSHARAVSAVATALALLMSMAATRASAGAEHPRLEAACVAYDLHILTLIEDHGLVEDTHPETLRHAAFQMLEARAACRSGHVSRALALYERISLDHVPMTPLYRILMR